MRLVGVFLLAWAILGRFVMPVGAQVISIESIIHQDGATLEVTTTEPVVCTLTLSSSAHQVLTFTITKDSTVNIPEWDLGWSFIECDGVFGGSNTQINLENGYTIGVSFIYIEEPAPEPEGVDSIDVTQTGVPVDDYYTFIVNVIGANYVPTCEIVTDMYPIGITEYEPLRSFPAYIDHGQQGVKGNVTLTCDGLSSTIEFKGNYDTDGVVLLKRSGVNGGTTGGGRAGNNTVKPEKPFLIEEDRVCWIGSVRVFVRDGNILVYGPEDVGLSENVTLLANATATDIITADTSTGNVPIGWSLNGLVNIYRLNTGEVQIDVIDPRSAPKKDICWLNADGTLLRTGWEG